jgi:hypothetical protein
MLSAVVCCAGLLAGQASAGAQSLFAGTPSDVGGLPTRARKSAAPEITTPFTYEAVRQETFPGLKPSILVGESVIRLVGKGFGKEPDGRTIMLKLSTSEAPFALTVLSWRDDEVRAELPALDVLEIDAKMAADMKRGLTARKHIAGPKAQVGMQLEGKWIAKPKHAQLAVAWIDLDGDGHDADDCDDFDARRVPGLKEQTDAAGLDEDCNPATESAPVPVTPAPAPLVPGSEPGAATSEPASAPGVPPTSASGQPPQAPAAAPEKPAKDPLDDLFAPAF